MLRILIAVLLFAPMALAQGISKKISRESEGLTAYTVLTAQPSANEGWGKYWGKCGYKDPHDNWAISPQFDWAGQFHEGYALAVVGAHVHHDRHFLTKWENQVWHKTREGGEVLIFDGGHLSVIDKSGKEVLQLTRPEGKLITPITWKTSESITSHSMDPIFINSKGDMLWGLSYFKFVDDMAWVESANGCAYLRRSGDSVAYVSRDSFMRCRDFREGLAAVGIADKKTYIKWGFIGKDGQWVIRPNYTEVGDFSDGVAAVQNIRLDYRHYWGAIDKSGNVLIAPELDKSFEFSEGLAYYAGHYMDKQGKTVFVLDKSLVGGTPYLFHDGLARYAVSTSAESGKERKTETVYFDRTGKVVFRFHADCTDFSRKVASCTASNDSGRLFFDITGYIVDKGGKTAQLEKDLADTPVGASAATASSAKKVIMDKPEYDAYQSALKTQDLLGRASAMDEFARKYPNSVVKLDAQEEAMMAYLQGGNQARAGELAQTALKLAPDDIRALTVMAWLKRMAAAQGDSQAAAEAWTYADRGLKLLPGWKKPDAMPDADFAKAHDQSAAVFYGAAGLHALGGRDYATARDNFQKALVLQPSSMLDLYQIGIAELAMTPLDVKGFWHIGRAIQVAREQKQAAVEQAITGFGKPIYRSYHGSEEGWEAVIAAAKGQAPPAGFEVRPAPGARSQSGKGGDSMEKVLADPILAKVLHVNGGGDLDTDLSGADIDRGSRELDASLAEAEGNDLLKQSDLQGAIGAYRKAVSLDPQNVHHHTALAKALAEKGDFDGAIQEFGESVRLEPRVAAHYYSRGWCYHSKGQFDKGLADYNKALELDPNFAYAVEGRAEVFYATHEFQKAIVEHTTFLKAVPKSPEVYARRAESYLALQDYRKAITDYETAIELDPKGLKVYNSLAWLLATTPAAGVRNGAKAVEYGQKSMSLADKSQSFLYMDTLAAAYAEVGRFADAVALQSKAIALIPKDFDEKEAANMKSRLVLYKANKPYRDAQ